MSKKVLILITCFALGVLGQGFNPRFPKRVEHETETCQTSEQGYYAMDPNDCQKYYICTSDGQALARTCAPQFYHSIDDKIGECRPFRDVTCGTRGHPFVEFRKGKSIQPKVQVGPSIESEDPNETNDVSWRENENCSGQKDGTYTIPNQCKKFLTCHDGHGYVSSCPANLVFDELVESCNYLENTERRDCSEWEKSNVANGNTDIESLEGYSYIEPWMNDLDCSGLSDGKHAIPNHCGVYYSCLGGKNLGTQQCAVGTAFQNTHGFEGDCFLGEEVSRNDCKEKKYCERNGAGNHYTKDFACDSYVYCSSNDGMAHVNNCPIDTIFEYINEHQGYACVSREQKTRLDCN